MKKLLAIAALCLLSGSAFAQQSVEAQVKDLKTQVTTLQGEVQGLSQRLASVEQLNISLRKALNFGQPITTATGKNGVTYNLLSIVGNKKERTIKVVFQVTTTAEAVNFNTMLNEAVYTDIQGNRKKHYHFQLGEELFLTIYKDVPTNGTIIFSEVDVDAAQLIKLLGFSITNNNEDEIIHFRDLKVDWR